MEQANYCLFCLYMMVSGFALKLQNSCLYSLHGCSSASLGDATVTISHRYTPKEQLRQHTKIADIIVAAAGNNFLYFVYSIFQSKCVLQS